MFTGSRMNQYTITHPAVTSICFSPEPYAAVAHRAWKSLTFAEQIERLRGRGPAPNCRREIRRERPGERHFDWRAEFTAGTNLNQAVLGNRLGVGTLPAHVADDKEPVI